MPGQFTPHLTPTERLFAEALATHEVPWRTAVSLAKQFTAEYLLLAICHYNFERGNPGNHSLDWRWLVTRIRLHVAAPRDYPFSDEAL